MNFIRKFFLALVALGLVALLVFQIILMGSTADNVAIDPQSGDAASLLADLA